jgi:hypothetical protein
MIFPRKSAGLPTGRKSSRAFAARLGMGAHVNESLPFRRRVDLGAVGESVAKRRLLKCRRMNFQVQVQTLKVAWGQRPNPASSFNLIEDWARPASSLGRSHRSQHSAIH